MRSVFRARWGEEEPGAEHLLLAAIGLPDGTAAGALGRVRVDAERIREALREEQADALVSVGVPREAAERMATPEPLGPEAKPLLYGAGPSATEAFRSAGDMARAAKQQLAGAHVVVAVAVPSEGRWRGSSSAWVSTASSWRRRRGTRSRLADGARGPGPRPADLGHTGSAQVGRLAECHHIAGTSGIERHPTGAI